MEFEKITQHIIIGIKEEFEFQMKLIYLKGLKWAENKQWLSPLAQICTCANRSFIQVDVGISYVSIASAGFEQRTAGWVMWQRMMWMAITVSMNEYASPARTPVRALCISLSVSFYAGSWDEADCPVRCCHKFTVLIVFDFKALCGINHRTAATSWLWLTWG